MSTSLLLFSSLSLVDREGEREGKRKMDG